MTSTFAYWLVMVLVKKEDSCKDFFHGLSCYFHVLFLELCFFILRNVFDHIEECTWVIVWLSWKLRMDVIDEENTSSAIFCLKGTFFLNCFHGLMHLRYWLDLGCNWVVIFLPVICCDALLFRFNSEFIEILNYWMSYGKWKRDLEFSLETLILCKKVLSQLL